MKRLFLEQDLPTTEDLSAILTEGLPECEVVKGWGVVDWILVKQSFFIGARIKVNEKRRCIEIRPTYGSRWVALMALLTLGLLLLIDLFNMRKKKQLGDKAYLHLKRTFLPADHPRSPHLKTNDW